MVIGINGDPVERHGEAGLMLRERLFLGYQEKSQIIEVISYNPDAGRFEISGGARTTVRMVRHGSRTRIVRCA